MTAIDVGGAATDRASAWGAAFTTVIDLNNPANAAGTITTIEIWAQSELSGCKAGTFFGSGTVYSNRDYETLGTVAAGSKQTFSGLALQVYTGDFIGAYCSAGNIEADTSGSGAYFLSATDAMGGGKLTYIYNPGATLSVYGIGDTGSTIYMGSPVVNRALGQIGTYTLIDYSTPANLDGVITKFECWFATDATGVKMGTFTGSGTDWDDHDYATLGDVASGSKQTFSGLNVAVSVGDCIGAYWATGQMEVDTSGGAVGLGYVSGDKFGAGVATYTAAANLILSMLGTGGSGWANIAKINGIVSSSVGKVNGIVSSSVGKVNGVAV